MVIFIIHQSWPFPSGLFIVQQQLLYTYFSTVYSTTQYTSSTFQSLYCSRGKSKKKISLIFVKYEYINRGTCKSFVAFPPYVYSLLPHIYFNHIGQTALHLDYILQNPFYSKSNFQKKQISV